ncbi:MAG: biotin/lipoyl-binding protein [Anaerolineaceae bacterium]|nr:biotin/lipoyl-binding protein [Anaerolineaceae bacterium]
MKVILNIEGKQYQVKIDDLNTRPVIAEVNGQPYEVWPEDQQEPTPTAQSSVPTAAVAAPPVPAPSAAGNLTITSPLPGVIIAIEVKEGQAVSKGQELYVLEAMKMKNSIKTDRDGVIASIHVSAGEQVRHNQPIITFEG